jgi:hypothetical protein
LALDLRVQKKTAIAVIIAILPKESSQMPVGGILPSITSRIFPPANPVIAAKNITPKNI